MAQRTKNRTANVAVNGKAIRKRRQLLGIDPAPFAERCGITPGHLSNLETGYRRFTTASTFGRICIALGFLQISERATIMLDDETEPAA